MKWLRKIMAASPSAPSITSIVFDQTGYNLGQLITVTVTYVPGTSNSVQTFTGTAKDSTTGKTGTLSVNFTVIINDSTIVSVSDSGNRTWTKVSDTGTVAIFTATA